MPGFNRAIDIAFDRTSGEVLEASDVFDTKKNSFDLRRRFSRRELDLYCCECDQRLNVSTSKLDRLYFKHEPGHRPCLLTDYDLSPRELEQIRNIIRSKESNRHKELKNLIAQRLLKVSGVDPVSVAVDNRFILRDGEKRKPDVYCRYNDRALAYEIQLSDLSLKYILDRHEFYKRNGIYLIWILDNYDLHSQSQMVRDIKYLNKYQNFFKLNEDVQDFQLLCDYKYHYLTSESDVHTKWARQSVRLDQLKFDEEERQAYYFDFEADKKRADAERIVRESAIHKAEQKKRFEELKVQAMQSADQVIQAIKTSRDTNCMIYDGIYRQISALSPLGVTTLNEKLGFQKPRTSGMPALNSYLKTATRKDLEFIGLLLDNEWIWIDVNLAGPDKATTLQEIYTNPALINKSVYVSKLLKRGYYLTESDKAFLVQHNEDHRSILLYEVSDRLKDRSMVPDIFSNAAMIYILESARKNQIVGYNYPPNAWLAFGNNALHPSYAKYWAYIETAFRRYGIWDIILRQDEQKGIFKRKLAERMDSIPEQDYSLDDLFKDLFFDSDVRISLYT